MRMICVMVLALLAGAILVAPGLAQEKLDVTGDWEIAIQSEAGNFSPKASLQQDGEKLSGTYRGSFGESKLEGTLKGRDIQWKTTISAQGQAVEITYTGVVEKDGTMKGKVELGEFGSGQWTAKRKEKG